MHRITSARAAKQIGQQRFLLLEPRSALPTRPGAATAARSLQGAGGGSGVTVTTEQAGVLPIHGLQELLVTR